MTALSRAATGRGLKAASGRRTPNQGPESSRIKSVTWGCALRFRGPIPRLRRIALVSMLLRRMDHSEDIRKDNRPGDDPSANGSIPPRAHYMAPRAQWVPPPSIRRHTIRLAVATGIGVVLMLVLLWLAIQYAQRDWTQKNTRARARGARPAAAKTTNGKQKSARPAGWTYTLPPAVTQRQLRRMASSRSGIQWWPILASGISSQRPDLAVQALHMALAATGDHAEFRNDLGVIYLKQKRPQKAFHQFQVADQIQPGFLPSRFNLALWAIGERNPTRALQWLGQYLARHSEDVGALRLQSTLLSQMNRPEEALRLLENFLKTQPPEQPLFLEAAMLAARLDQHGNALRYLETALNGNPIQNVIRAYQSPTFRDIRLSGKGDTLAARMAAKARTAFGAPVPVEEIGPLWTPWNLNQAP